MLFCITGTGRCGSRLLHEMFNTHPQLYVYNETHWLPKMFEFYGTGEASVDSLIEIINRTSHVTGKPTTKFDEIDLGKIFSGATRMTIAEFCDVLGSAFATQQGKSFWADKTPDYGPHLQMLQTLWPKCRIVHIVRHGKEVALSMSRHSGYKWMASANEAWWCPASYNGYSRIVKTDNQPFEIFIELWYRRYMRIRDESTRLQPDSYLEIEFEALIQQPENTLRTVASFIGLPAPQDWLTDSVSNIDTGRIRSHASKIPNDGIEARHASLLAALGYE